MPGILPTVSRSILESEDDGSLITARWILTTADPIGVPIAIPDYFDKVWTIGNASGNAFGGATCSLKGSNLRTQISTASGAVSHTWGTFSGATSDSAGYAIGATSITLAAAGSGTLLVGDNFTFPGDPTLYRILAGLADVSVGGAITIAGPGLVKALPASPQALTPALSYLAGISQTIFLNAAGTGTLLVGSQFTFAGDSTIYTVSTGDIDISNGATLSFRPILQKSLTLAGVAITLVPGDSGQVLDKAGAGTPATATVAAVIATVENCTYVYPQLTTVGAGATITVTLLARKSALLRNRRRNRS